MMNDEQKKQTENEQRDRECSEKARESCWVLSVAVVAEKGRGRGSGGDGGGAAGIGA